MHSRLDRHGLFPDDHDGFILDPPKVVRYTLPPPRFPPWPLIEDGHGKRTQEEHI